LFDLIIFEKIEMLTTSSKHLLSIHTYRINDT